VNGKPSHGKELFCHDDSIETTDAESNQETKVPELPKDTSARDVSQSAYEVALFSLSSDDRNRLEESTTIRALFETLNEADQKHKEESLLRKGLGAVKPYLEKLNATIDIVSPFTSTEPAVGTAFGLIKGASTVSHDVPYELMPFTECRVER